MTRHEAYQHMLAINRGDYEMGGAERDACWQRPPRFNEQSPELRR